MTKEEAIAILEDNKPSIIFEDEKLQKESADISIALDMAIKALENIGHLTDRPCDVCEFHKEHGCCKWTCVFCDSLFGDMRGAE